MRITHLQILAFLWSYVRRYWGLIIMMILILLGNTALTLIQPLFYRDLIDTIAGADSMSPEVITNATRYILLGVACGAGALTLHESAVFFLIRLSVPVLRRTHRDVFNHVQRLSTQFHLDTFAGSTSRKINRGTNAMERIIDLLWFNFIPLVVFIAGLSIVLTLLAPLLGLVMITGMTLYAIVAVCFGLYTSKLMSWADKQDTVVSGSLVDAITGNAQVKAAGREDFEVSRHGKHLQELSRRQYWNWCTSSTVSWIQFMLLMAVELTAFLTALHLWKTGTFSTGSFIVVLFYMGQVWHRMFEIGQWLREYLQAMANAEEMLELWRTPLQVKQALNAQDLDASKGGVTFDAVTFGYGSREPIFTDFSLDIKPGEKIAIVGHSGGGKSTFVKLLQRLYDIQDGCILIDNQNIAEVTLSSLRQQIGLVPQDPVLFHRSIAENIAYERPEATEQQIIEAAKLAHAHEFIATLPEGYDTLVGERGVKLSGGERQRVAIARAILADTPILILDEATSSLDSQSEQYIQDALHALLQDRTSIVIAHRLSTIKEVDRIIVIEQGRILEQGSHDELLNKKDSVYKHLYELQAGGFIGE